MLRCIHGVGGGACSCEMHTVSMLRCIHGVGGGMLTFMWSAYGVDATLHTWGGWGHVNVHVKCIRCRCYVAYMGWGGHVRVHVKCIRCRCYVAYMGWVGHVNVHVKCIRCRCYVAYMGWGGACSRSCEVHTVSMLRCIHVKHSLGEFTKRVAERLRRNRLGGTQVLDRIWDSLKELCLALWVLDSCVPGCHALALAALCMDVVLETQDLEWRIRCFRKFRSFDVQSEWRLGLLEITSRRQARSEKRSLAKHVWAWDEVFERNVSSEMTFSL